MAAMWSEAERHVRAARVLLRTGHHGCGPADEAAVKRLTCEVLALQTILKRYRAGFNLPEMGKDVEPPTAEAEGVSGTAKPPQPRDGDGAGMEVAGEQQQLQLHQQVGAPHTTAAPSCHGPVAVPLLNRLTSELVVAICSLISEEERRALRASCRAGRDALRAATTTWTVDLNPRGSQPGSVSHYLPAQDPSITHNNMQHLKLRLHNQHPYLPTDLAAAAPGVFQRLKSLTLHWDQLGEAGQLTLLEEVKEDDADWRFPDAVPYAMLRELQDIVALCTQLSKLELSAGGMHFVFSAPGDQLLEGLDLMFQDRLFNQDRLIATLPAQKYLTQAHPDNLPLSSMEGFLRCSRLEHMKYKYQLDYELPQGLSALSQLRYLDLYLLPGPYHVLQALPQLIHLVLELRPDDVLEDSVEDDQEAHPSPTASLHLPALQHLEVADWSNGCGSARFFLAAVSAPQLIKLKVLNSSPLPIHLMLEFASRHPNMLTEGYSGYEAYPMKLECNGHQLMAAAHQLPVLLNHTMHLRNATLHQIQEAVRVVGTQLYRLCLEGEDDRRLLLNDSLLHELAASCPNLKDLQLSTAEKGGFTPEGVSALANSLHGLERLNLWGLGHALDDVCIRDLGRGCPLLHSLELPGCGSVSEEAVADLCIAARNMTVLVSMGKPRLGGFQLSEGLLRRIEDGRAVRWKQ